MVPRCRSLSMDWPHLARSCVTCTGVPCAAKRRREPHTREHTRTHSAQHEHSRSARRHTQAHRPCEQVRLLVTLPVGAASRARARYVPCAPPRVGGGRGVYPLRDPFFLVLAVMRAEKRWALDNATRAVSVGLWEKSRM